MHPPPRCALLLLALPLVGCASPTWHGETVAPGDPFDAVSESDPGDSDAPGPAPEECGNGIDDDLDSLTDCADPECSSLDLCAVEDERVSVRFSGGLWATYAADEAHVYEDSGRLDGALLVRRESRRDGVWQVDCQSQVEVSGAPTEAPDADLAFDVAPILPPQHDGCSFGAQLPELPTMVALRRDAGDAIAGFEAGTVPWQIAEGQVDWSGWTSAGDYHVDSQGGPLTLAAGD